MAAWRKTLLLLVFCAACPMRGTGGPTALPEVSLPADVPALLQIADDASTPARALAAARRALALRPEAPEVAWRAARACLWLADTAKDGEKVRFAEEGVGYGERALKTAPKSGEAHYYLATNLGLVAQSRGAAALSVVPRIAALGKKAVELTPELETGGPERLVGMLYAKAPPWPTSIGDLDESLRHLRRVVERFPDDPLNHLFLAEALLGGERWAEAKTELRKVLAAPPRGSWARVGKRWRKHARHLLRRAEVGARQEE